MVVRVYYEYQSSLSIHLLSTSKYPLYRDLGSVFVWVLILFVQDIGFRVYDFLSKSLGYEKKSRPHRVQVGFKVQLMKRPDDCVGGLRSKLAQSLRPK